MSVQELNIHLNARLNPGEHILSMLSRHHMLSGYRTFKDAISFLSEDVTRQYPTAVDRPIYRDLFNVFACDKDYEGFLKAHTLLNWYAPFMPEQLLDFKSDTVLFPHFYNRFNATHEWKHCLSCMGRDIEKYGAPFYHLEHQLPLQHECSLHKEKLYSGCNHCDKSWKNIDLLGLPTGEQCHFCEQQLSPVNQYVDDDMLWLQKSARKLLSSNTAPFKLEQLQKAYQIALGIKKSNKAFSQAEAKKMNSLQLELDNFFDPRLYHCIFNNCDTKNGNKRTSSLHLYQIAFHTDKFFAPIVHLLIIRMLFGELENIPCF
jgi:hypothetical protein